MEQRSLRLGDVVDDYCPRERRLTNHAIVAIVDDSIRQTRCTTCDHEHVYKQAREPRRRKAPPGSLFDQVLADVAGPQRVSVRVVPPVEATPPPVVEAAAAVLEAQHPAADEPQAHGRVDDPLPAHRTLIRASLPRTAAEPPPPRPIPEFTMHQKPQSARVRHARALYGPQGDPFGRPAPGGHARGGHGHGHGPSPAQGQEPGQRRGRRRRGGKRSH